MAIRNLYYKNTSRSLLLWLGLALLIAVLDQLSKIGIAHVLHDGQILRLTSFFNLILAYNKGAAFSFLASQSGWQRHFFAIISIVAILLIMYLLKKHAHQTLFCLSLSLILGGAVGNLIDRLLYGHVIDFLDVHALGWHWPTFNIADCGITMGAILFIIDELKRVRKN